MRRSILLAQVWSTRKSIIFWSATLSVATVIALSLFKPIASELGLALSDIGIMQLFGGSGVFNSASGWLGLQLYSFTLPVLLAIAGSITGANAIGREEKTGTIELLLSSPVSRTRLLIEKAAGVALQLGIICLAVWLTIVICRDTFSLDISLTNAVFATLSAFLTGLLFAYTAMTIQATYNKIGLAIGICLALLVLAYATNLSASMIGSIESIKYLSVFHYYDGQDSLLYGLKRTNLAILTLANVTLVVASLLTLKHRDIGA